jgi:hypothetical protein
MRTDKLDEAGFELVGKVDDKAILVPADVEDGSVISDKVHIISERSFLVRRPTPLSFGNDLITGAEWCLGLRVSFPKDLKCLPGYYIHRHSMFPPWDQSKFPPWEHINRP